MKTFRQFIQEASEKLNIRGNLCHENGRFTACNKEFAAQKKKRPPKQVESPIVSKFTKPVLKADIDKSVKDLKERGSYLGDDNAHEILKSFNLTPHDVINGVLGLDTSKPYKGDITIKAKGNKLYIEAEDFTHSETNAKIARCSRIIDLKNKTVEHDYLRLEENSQGSNAVKQLFKTALPVYDQMGLKKITLHANLAAGGYAWAKFGFKPDNTKKTKENLHSIVRSGNAAFMLSLESIKEKTGEVLDDKAQKEYDAITKLLKTDNLKPNTITQIANLKTPNFDKFLNKHRAHINRSFPPNVKVNAAKVILKQSHWYGGLNLKKDRATLEAYINA